MKWTEDDIKYLIENYPKLTIGEISENLLNFLYKKKRTF